MLIPGFISLTSNRDRILLLIAPLLFGTSVFCLFTSFSLTNLLSCMGKSVFCSWEFSDPDSCPYLWFSHPGMQLSLTKKVIQKRQLFLHRYWSFIDIILSLFKQLSIMSIYVAFWFFLLIHRWFRICIHYIWNKNTLHKILHIFGFSYLWVSQRQLIFDIRKWQWLVS